MKPNDKITVEITLAELAKAYILFGNCVYKKEHDHLYNKAKEVFGGESSTILNNEDVRYGKMGIPHNAVFNFGKDQVEYLLYLFNQETEQQKRIRELKETIAKAQQQIKELEISDEH